MKTKIINSLEVEDLEDKIEETSQKAGQKTQIFKRRKSNF